MLGPVLAKREPDFSRTVLVGFVLQHRYNHLTGVSNRIRGDHESPQVPQSSLRAFVDGGSNTCFLGDDWAPNNADLAKYMLSYGIPAYVSGEARSGDGIGPEIDR